MKLWLFPIEPLEERYSDQWYTWWPTVLRELGVDVHVVNGARLTEKIEDGQFLDVTDTNHYKATQLAEFAKLYHAGAVHTSDIVLLLDAWNPQLLSLAYMRDLGRIKFKIAGLFHAGSYDPWDLLGQNEAVKKWAYNAELSFMESIDRVFVATDYHRRLLHARRETFASDCESKIVVTGFPLYANTWSKWFTPWESRQVRRVVFPHRLAPEKAPDDFNRVRRAYTYRYGDDGTEWVRTKDVCYDKASYYALLGNSTVAFSSANQETWGIAMLEAASLGCWPVVPNRLSYRETFPSAHRYDDLDQAVLMIYEALNRPHCYPYDGARWETSINRMADNLRNL